MKTNLGAKKVGAVGYCFGGRYVARFLATGKGLDAGFVAHPTATTTEEFQAVAGPFSIGAAGKSQPHPQTNRANVNQRN